MVLVVFPPYICLCVYMSEVISAFTGAREGSPLFAFLMLFLVLFVLYFVCLLGVLCMYVGDMSRYALTAM